MRRISIIVLAALMPLLWQGCDTYPENPNKPLAYINFTIYPNSIRR